MPASRLRKCRARNRVMRWLTLALLAFLPGGTQAALSWQSLPPLPDPLGVAAPFAGVADGQLVVAGGATARLSTE